MGDKNLVPSYLEADFLTALTKNTELLKASNTFRDYNFHGSNFTMILELLSYLADFSSFHANLVAKNVYMDSASIYETVHALAQQKGYNARGYVSPYITITVDISGSFRVGDQIYIDPWQEINTNLTNDSGDQIYYTITNDYTYTVPMPDGMVIPSGDTLPIVNFISFDILARQGYIETRKYTGEDIIDNQIILPFHDYDYGSFPFTLPSINVWVNDEKWLRVSDFYDLLSGLIDLKSYDRDQDYRDNDDVFMFKYDKYKRYILQFNSSRNVPTQYDDITVNLIRSLGVEGGLQQEALTTSNAENLIITNITTGDVIDPQQITNFVNYNPSVGGNNPEDIQEIKIGARSNVHSQYRNITSRDYKYHLESRSDVIKGLAWGEQEVDPGNVLEYNKTYITVIPEPGLDSLFSLGTINTTEVEWLWTDDLNQNISNNIEIATSYVQDFKNDVLQYLEPRKMINNYEVMVLPDIVYFRFDIGIRVRRTYTYKDVMGDVRDKLVYFFDWSNRAFHEEISFMDIHNFILDLSIVSEFSEFKYIAGVDNLVLRDLGVYTSFNMGHEQVIFEPPGMVGGPGPSGCYGNGATFKGCFPQYKYNAYQGYVDNKLRPILLDYNQFPMLAVNMCRFFREV